MDRWQYARDEHPAYCTCVKCVEANKEGGRKRSRKSAVSTPGSIWGLVVTWFKRLLRGR